MGIKSELLYLKVLGKGHCSAMVSSCVKQIPFGTMGGSLMGYIREAKVFWKSDYVWFSHYFHCLVLGQYLEIVFYLSSFLSYQKGYKLGQHFIFIPKEESLEVGLGWHFPGLWKVRWIRRQIFIFRLWSLLLYMVFDYI